MQTQRPNWFLAAVEILQTQSKIGIVKLRIENDGQYEMHTANVLNGTAEFYSPWWLNPMPNYVKKDICSNGLMYYYALLKKGYTNNPHLLKMDMIKDWKFDDAVKGYGKEEELVENRPGLEGWYTANLEHGVFKHIG